MKKTFVLITAMIFSLSLLAPSAIAGSKQRHRWQGVAIGLGAAILGNAIFNNCRDYPPPERVVVRERYDYNHSYCPPRHHPRHYSGHWEVRKTWVPPACERAWNPGHYNRYNYWVPGQWITIEKAPGYWTKKRVWVARR